MINVTLIVETIKNLIEGERRYILLVMFFSGAAIAYIYNDNQKLNEKMLSYEKDCQQILLNSKMFYEAQILSDRKSSQEQINDFIKKSNYERDSIYKYFSKEIEKTNKVVVKTIKKIEENEVNN